MQLLVFAHTPPPVHGQSLMVQTLVEGLPATAPGIKLHHVNVRLSRDSTDIGRWRPAKLIPLLAACLRALTLRARHGPMTFYYIPAPAKRGALYRDFIVMLLCRPFFKALVLHWHAVGLGEWLTHHATALERWLAARLLGHADLAIVLAPELLADANVLSPRRTAVVPNGIPDPPPPDPTTQNPKPKTQNLSLPTEVLFLGLCTKEKGLFDTLAAVAIANQREPSSLRLTVAGTFPNSADEDAFTTQATALGVEKVRYVGFADGQKKHELLSSADVFCFPTTYPHEGQPLTLIEALAYDVPIVTTRWRAIPSMLPSEHVWLVEPSHPDQLAAALLAARHAPPPRGQLRAHYLAHFSRTTHLNSLSSALGSICPRVSV